MPLSVSVGHASRAGLRERNEDFVGMVTPSDPELSTKGLTAAVADGVSGNEGGREASEYTVRGLLADYYATPDTWPVTQALDRSPDLLPRNCTEPTLRRLIQRFSCAGNLEAKLRPPFLIAWHMASRRSSTCMVRPPNCPTMH